MSNNDFDLLARIYLLTKMEGGRRTPFKSGYRPNIKLCSQLYDVVVYVEGQDWVHGGETVTVKMSFLRPELQNGKLSSGQSFELCEASHIVGYGQILTIFRFELKQHEDPDGGVALA